MNSVRERMGRVREQLFGKGIAELMDLEKSYEVFDYAGVECNW